MQHTLRRRFKKEIVAEYLPPARTTRRRRATGRATKRQRVMIILDGAPSIPTKSSLVHFFSRKGFLAIYPRFRGAWESDGVFLRKSPEQDVLDIIDSLPRGSEIFIIAPSFGGPAGILASRDSRVVKVVCISPVVDWQAPSKAEPLPWLEKFMHEAFGNGYRFGKNEWKKLSGGKFYNPMRHAAEIDGSKLLIFHARDDESVRSREVEKFARATGATLKLFKTGGHLSTVRTINRNWKQIKKFIG
jgi:alpha-beta hydrolase superfamily lysophospholipase